MVLSTFMIGFTLARIVDAYGMLYRVFRARRIGSGFTYILQFIATIFVGVLLVN